MRNLSSSGRHPSRCERFELLLYVGLVTPLILGLVGNHPVQAGQLTTSAFQSYSAANFATIQPGPFALYTVNVNGIRPTQLNEGFAEVGKKSAGFDLLTPSALTANLLTAIEPVVIGPGGQLFVTDGHHTFTALEDSIYGASNPTVFVNVVANYSNLTNAQFFATLQSQNLLLPLNDGVAVPVVLATGSPIPTSLTGLTGDVYRGLEYGILKNKSSKLFTTANNITGAVGASTPGLDKMTGFYSDFLEADAYRNANGGLGLPYQSPGDIALATQWNLNPASVTTLPNIAGTVTAAQLPGFILANNIVNNTVISNATLANGALDGNGTFTGITTINAGTAAEPIIIGTPNTGFVLQLGFDKGNMVTLGGANTYTGGTSILAGSLIVASDAALGAAPTGAAIDPANVKNSIQAANGIVFNSLTEGMGQLTLGTTVGTGTTSFTSARPIAVSGETATINLNGNLTTLTGPIASFGSNGVGLGNAMGESDLTIDDNANNKGVLTLSTPSPLFYGNLVIGSVDAPTVRVTNDAALGNTTGPAASIGQVDLNSGTFQAGASFSAPERNFFLASGSNFDVDGFTTTFGSLTDSQRTLDILNSNTTTAGAVTFSNLTISATPTLQLAGGAAGETVTLTNGIVRTGNDTLVIQPTSATSLGTTEKLYSGIGAASLVDGIAPAYIVTNNGAAKSVGPYDFVTYGANGYIKTTYTATTLTNAPTSVVALGANAAPAGSVSAFALNTEGKTITLGAANTLTLGDGTNPGGLILATGSAISGGTLAFGGSEGVIWLSGTNPTISSKITGTNGLTFAGSGGVAISGAAAVSGPITIDSGSVTLAGANIFSSDTSGILLANVKKSPAPSTLAVTANNTLTALNSAGNNSVVTLSNGAALTLGDTTNNLSSTLSSTITETGAAALGALTFNGSGLFDLSGGKATLVAGSTVVVNNSAKLRVAAGVLSTATGIILNGTSELQLAQNGGGLLPNAISGTGDLRLIGGTLQITGTTNTYSGGTFVETGSTLDITTANLPAINPNITNAGGLIVFDQTTAGIYTGVISDGKELGTGPMLQGSLDKDDSSGGNTGNVTIVTAQTYTGATTVEAGTLTLGAVDTLATSSGVDLGRVGGGATATLALSANNTIQALTSEASNTTGVTLGANVVTINTAAATAATFGGVISGTGSVVKSGAGTETFTGANTYSGGTKVQAGELAITGAGTLGGTTGPLAVSGGILDLGTTAQTTGPLTLTGGTIQNGTLKASAFGLQAGTISAGLAGAGALTKTTTGIVTLSGANTYTSATSVSAGTLSLIGSLGATATTVANGATLSGTGSSAGSVTVANGGTLSPGLPGAGNVGALTVAGLTLQTGSALALDLGTPNVVGGVTNDRVQDNGQLTLGGTVAVNPGATFGSGGYRLVDYTGALTNNGIAVAGLPTGDTALVQTAIGGQVNLVVTAPGGLVQYWDGATTSGDGTIHGGSGTWNATNGNWTSPSGAFNQQWASSFGIFAGAAGTVTLADNEAFSGLEFSTSGYVVNAASGATLAPTGQAVLRADQGVTATIAAPLTGVGSITKTDAGTVVLTGADTYSGGTTVAAGTLQLGNGGTTGSIVGNVANNGTFVFNHSDTETFAGTISGIGVVAQIGTGTTVLTAANTFTGGLTISAGTLQLGTGGTTGSAIGAINDAGTLAFDHSDAETFAGTISGSGVVAQIGTGNTTLSGANIYSGGTTLSSGSITVANNAALGTGTLAMAAGTALAFAPGSNYTIGNAVTISGDPTFNSPTGQTNTIAGVIADGTAPGFLEKTGGGTLVLAANNTYSGGTSIDAGTLQLGNSGTTGSIVGNVANAGTLAFDRSIASTFAGAISGAGGVSQIGTGTTTLTGMNTYTGATTVASGTLLVDGSIASSSAVMVGSGATLGGNGVLPSVAVGAGTLAPGATSGSIGTLSVLGAVTFSNASTYLVDVSPASASMTASGSATLAGTAAALFQPGSYLTRQYTILTAATGITGTFGALATGNLPPGFAATLAYDAKDAYLDLTTTNSLTGLNSDQRAVAGGLNNAFTNGAALPPAFVAIFGQTGTTFANSLSQISGEGITAAQSAAHRQSSLFTSTITDQTTFYGDPGSAGNAIVLSDAVPGFVSPAPQRELADLPTQATQPQEVIPFRTRTWRAWATGFGGTEDIHGDPTLGSNAVSTTLYGGSLGIDYQVSPNFLAGLAIGGSDGEFSLPTLATSGSTTGGHVAFYNLATFGAFYGATSNSFSYYTNKTTRTAVGETEQGRFDSHEFRTRAEFGRHVAIYGATLTPFVALEIADLRSNGFTETSLTGPSQFGLNVQGQSVASVPGIVGARWQQTASLGNGLVFLPSVQLAYVHEFAPERSQIAGFAALPGATFLVDGARPDRNAAQIKIGGQLGITPASAFFASFDSELSGRAQFYGGKGGFKYVW